MEKLSLIKLGLEKALKTFREILNEPFSLIVRDAAIQRFEYTFEIFWKFLKEYIRINEGIICNSPKSTFREVFKAGFLAEEETIKLLEMTDDRNLTSHTYNEDVAKYIYEEINDYCTLMENIFKRVEEKNITQLS